LVMANLLVSFAIVSALKLSQATRFLPEIGKAWVRVQCNQLLLASSSSSLSLSGLTIPVPVETGEKPNI